MLKIRGKCSLSPSGRPCWPIISGLYFLHIKPWRLEKVAELNNAAPHRKKVGDHCYSAYCFLLLLLLLLLLLEHWKFKSCSLVTFSLLSFLSSSFSSSCSSSSSFFFLFSFFSSSSFTSTS